MKMRRRFAALLVIASLALPFARIAIGQEHEHEKPPPGKHDVDLTKSGGETKDDLAGEKGKEAGEGESIDIRALTVQIIGFVILAVILAKYAVPPAVAALRARSDRIRDELDALDREERAAAEAKSKAESGLKDVERTSIERMERAVKEGAELRDQLVREGDEGAEKVRYKAKLEIEIERQKMMLELRNEVVELSFEAAARVAKTVVDKETQDRLVDQFVENLESVAGA